MFTAMDWLRWHLGTFKVVIFVAALIVVAVGAGNNRLRRANTGFGPDWECTSQPRGTPTCIKKLQH
jgi:hypothetical protein